MKKIISLTITVGLLVISALAFFSSARAVDIPPGDPITQAGGTEPEQIGPEWYNEAWNYRRPVIISNSITNIDFYQVLVTLTSSNFDFSKAKADGSDLRFTHSDGITELYYWIESWDSAKKVAYLWVRVPGLPIGNTIIYLYYNNPTAGSVSDGLHTFLSFDDNWSALSSMEINQDEGTQISPSPDEVNTLFAWSTIKGTPIVSSGILSLPAGTGIKSTSTYQYRAVGFKANFGSGSGNEWVGFINADSGQRTMIGDLSYPYNNDMFLIDWVNAYDNILLPRVGGIDWHDAYHIYEVRWYPDKSVGDIDHGASTIPSTMPVQVPNIALPVTLYSFTGSNAILKVDWIYVRQYRDPEPTVLVSTAVQGLVELGITMIDFPDPLPTKRALTYQLNINNNSNMEAPGVTVSDTLPGSVQLSSTDPSQGSCEGSTTIVCNLGLIPANSTASITIVVIPNTNGNITNSATVSSPGYELDLSDNTSEAVTLVDSQPPVVHWASPVQDEGNYFTIGGKITLVATASDNDQIGRVDFRLWDHINNNWVELGTDTTTPYQVDFDSDRLKPCPMYQMYAYAYDRAGNFSRNRIFIERLCLIYMPLVIK